MLCDDLEGWGGDWDVRLKREETDIHLIRVIIQQKQTQHCQAIIVFVLTQSCPTLCDLVDCSLPGPSVHEIFQARILECVAISSSRGLSQHRVRTLFSASPASSGRFFTTVPPGNLKAIIV